MRRISAFGYRSDLSNHFASGECIMHTSPQPQFQTGSMPHSATTQAQFAAYPRTSGYGPIGHAINRMHQHQQSQPLPPPPPPLLPSPLPGTFTATAPLVPLLPTSHSPSPSPTPTQATPSPSPPQRAKPQVLPPPDFTPSPTHWDTRNIFGLDLPRFIKHTPHTEANNTAGIPITDLTRLQTVRHGWNSYWLRYLAHGHNTGLFFTKHISETVFASEFFSTLRNRKIDLDAAAIAYCHQHNIPTHTKQKAFTALVTEFVDYLQDICNESNSTAPVSSQHNPAAHQLKAPQQVDPATAQRLIALEHQLATANLTINHLRGQPTPLPSQPTTTHTKPISTADTHPNNIGAHSCDFSPIAPRNLQPHMEALGHESAPCKTLAPAGTRSPPSVVDITASPATTMMPKQRPPTNTALPTHNLPHQPACCHIHTNTSQHLHHTNLQQTPPTWPANHPNPSPIPHPEDPASVPSNLAATLLCSKKQRQSTLPGAPAPKPKTPLDAVLQQPPQRSQWFQQNCTGVHTDSGILRWFGSLKNVSEEQKAECRSYISEVLQAYPEITIEQRQQLEANAASWGIPIRLIDKFQTKPLLRLLCIIAQMSE